MLLLNNVAVQVLDINDAYKKLLMRVAIDQCSVIDYNMNSDVIVFEEPAHLERRALLKLLTF